jgi:hypothetical protein
MGAVRVVQWATGVTGRLALRAIITASDLELVGVRVYAPDKVGKDAGDLAGCPPTGIRAVDSLEAVLVLKPDIVFYAGRVEIDPDGCFADVEALLSAGIDVVATGSSFIDVRAFAPERAGGIEAACRRGESTFLGVGIFPGFWGEAIAPVLSRLAYRCETIIVRESLSYAGYASAEMISNMGYGHAPDWRPPASQGKRPTANPFIGTASVLAKALGLTIRSNESFRETKVTGAELHVAAGVIPAGTVGAMKLGVRADCGDLEIVVEHVTWMDPKVAPEWSGREGYEIEFEGAPSLRCSLLLGIHDEDHTDMGCLATAMHAIHAIPAVRAAAPGIIDLADVQSFVGRIA